MSKQNTSRTELDDHHRDDKHPWPEPLPLPPQTPPVDAFDVTMLPKAFQPWIADVAERLQCPMDFPAVGAMIAAAGIVGRKIAIRPQRNTPWQVVPNLWGGIVGRPGVMKTPALQEPLEILQQLQGEAKQEFDSDQKQHETSKILADAKRSKLQGDLKRAVAKNDESAGSIADSLRSLEPAKPSRRRYVVNDCTVEKLGELLNQNPNGLTLYRDELPGFLKALDKEGAESSRAFYLESWNGTGRFVYDRIGRGTLDIPAAIISVIGGIQPGPLSEYLSRLASGGAGDDGLLQRFQLLVFPDCPTAWKNVDRPADRTAKNAALDAYRKLDNLEAVALGAELDPGEHVPFLRFDDAAQVRFDEWRENLEIKVRSGEEHPAIESHLAKYRSLVPSLALLIHLVDEPEGGPVTEASLSRAIQWADYLESHARRIYQATAQPAVAAAYRLAKKLLDGSLPASFTVRDVYRKRWSGLADKTTVEAAVDVLVDHNWLVEETVTTGGRQKTTYWLNPKAGELNSHGKGSPKRSEQPPESEQPF